MTVIALPLAVCLIGLLIFVICKNGDLKEIGRTAYACGLLAFLLVASHVWRVT